MRSGHRVLVVEADFRAPHGAASHGLDPAGPGLAEVLLEGRSPLQVVRPAGPVQVVTAGAQRFTPSLARLVSKRVKPALAAYADDYDYILLDLPPLPTLVRTPDFARASQGLLLLLDQGQVGTDQLLAGLGRLQDANFTLRGILPIRALGEQPVRFPSAGQRRQADGQQRAS